MSSSSSSETVVSPDAPSIGAVHASRRKLLLILACFAIPLILATIWLQILRVQGGTYGDTSRGELVVPARPFEAFALQTQEGEVWGLDELRGRWSLLYLADGACEDACQQDLYHMRQVRLALNHRMDRVRRVVLPAATDPLPDTLVEEHPGLIILSGDAIARDGFVSQVKAAEADMHAERGEEGTPPEFNGIYLVDPNGNLMMRFSHDLDPRSMLKDLKHLLKVSRIG